MTWAAFWYDFESILILLRGFVSAIPAMIVDVLFAAVSFAAVWVLVRFIREVRS